MEPIRPACLDWSLEDLTRYQEPEVTLRKWQAGRCAFCGNSNPFKMLNDHDHNTGLVRGRICGPCNVSEGKADARFDIWRQQNPCSILGLEIKYEDTKRHSLFKWREW